jgi:hypothetical protein
MLVRSLLLALALAGIGGTAAADDAADIVGRVLEQLEVTPQGDGARVSVRFGCPLRYASHFPSAAVTELRISLAPLPGCLPTDVVDSALRAAAGNAAGLRDVRLEPVGSALVLTLVFDSPVDVQVRPAPDFLGLDVAVVGQVTMARARARVPVRTTAPVPEPWCGRRRPRTSWKSSGSRPGRPLTPVTIRLPCGC